MHPRGLLRLALILAFALPGPGRAAEFIPIVKLDALGGQFFFEGQHTSFSGNANWLISPGLKLSDKDTLLVSAIGQYRRVREVRELVGGGFLTEETLENTGLIQWSHAFNDAWSIRPNFSFKNELLAETSDETLGKGLFDYNRLSFGVEVERKSERLSLRPSCSAYGVRYYHYTDISAQAIQELGVEINSGGSTLDFNAYDCTLSAEWLLREGSLLSASWTGSYRNFLDQNIVTESGEFLDHVRQDFYSLWSAGIQQALPEWSLGELQVKNAAGLTAGLTLLNSNQHSFDAARTKFNPNYYDYREVAAIPFYTLRVNDKLSATVSYDYSRRDYRKRPAQLGDGSYTSDPIVLDTHTASLALSYPLYKGLSMKLQGSYRVTSSNMKYEQTYRYSYESAHYFMGLGYAL